MEVLFFVYKVGLVSVGAHARTLPTIDVSSHNYYMHKTHKCRTVNGSVT